MIRRIDRIKDFGVFENFQWPNSLNHFKKFNLIFGWNYSGKTTFSRTFRCFELMQRHVDFSTAEVQFSMQDGTRHQLSTIAAPHPFRVFNMDFVRENILFDTGTASPILILGTTDIAKQALLASKTDQVVEMNEQHKANLNKKAALRTKIERILTNDARKLKNSLSRPSYDKRQFEPKVNACIKNPSRFILDEQALAKTHSIYHSTDKKDALAEGSESDLASFSSLKNRVAKALIHTVTATTPIQRLTDNPDLESWVNQGRPLHKNKKNCQFCDRPLPEGLMSAIAAHFSAQYDVLMGDLDDLQTALTEAESEVIDFGRKADFYTEFQAEFEELEKAFSGTLKLRSRSLKALMQAIERKRTKAFTQIDVPEIEDSTSDINTAIKGLNKIVERHNARTAEFDKNRNDAFAKLEMDYAAHFVQDNDYRGILQQIEDLEASIKDESRKISTLDLEILQLERDLSDAVKGAETINELMQAYFGKDDIRIGVSPEKRFQIIRGGVIAKNLSEGERSAIAFAYFMTRLEDGKSKLSDTTVVIDDPMCSLDAHHLFNTYAFVKTWLVNCFQLFVLTHNYEFYSLMKEWAAEEEKFGKPQSDWKEWSIYLMRRKDDGSSILEVIPSELLRFKSEYHYLFATLYKFDQSTDHTFDYLFSLPNIARRFMEAFGGVMIPTHAGLKSKMPRLFTDKVSRERVWKFINHYSHNTSQTRSLVIPDISECRAVVRACLDAVKAWDSDYYNDLVSAVN